METIARKYLFQLLKRMENQGMQLVLPEDLAASLGAQVKPKDGARQLRRLVQQQVEGPLAEFMLRSGKKLTKIRCRWNGNELTFQG